MTPGIPPTINRGRGLRSTGRYSLAGSTLLHRNRRRVRLHGGPRSLIERAGHGHGWVAGVREKNSGRHSWPRPGRVYCLLVRGKQKLSGQRPDAVAGDDRRVFRRNTQRPAAGRRQRLKVLCHLNRTPLRLISADSGRRSLAGSGKNVLLGSREPRTVNLVCQWLILLYR